MLSMLRGLGIEPAVEEGDVTTFQTGTMTYDTSLPAGVSPAIFAASMGPTPYSPNQVSEQFGPPIPYGLTAAQYRTIVQANPHALGTPQSGTKPVASTSSMAQSIADALKSGANYYTQLQIQAALNQAKATGAPVYAPNSMVSKSGSSDWMIAGGVGAALLAVIVVIALSRR